MKNADITVRGIRTDQRNSPRTRQMAKPEHLDKLKEGVEVWNTWRHDNPEIVPALSEADLEEAVLSGADLREAKLMDAKLRDADLREANLEGANLLGANLKKTNLAGTNLRWAMYLQAEQLCEAKTLYKAKLDPELERQVKESRPFLFEKPRE